MSQIILPILGGLVTAVPPQIGYTAGGRPFLVFDGTIDNTVIYAFPMPTDFVSGLSLEVKYSMDAAITNNVALRSQMMAAADAVDVQTDSFATLEATADNVVPATAGLIKTIAHTLANRDGLAADSYCSIEIGRENATAGTNATGLMHVWGISLKYATA